eukprot:TRINITY_DN114042_c0_g1_i1.p1 TRINITY_DN114042_c0_g1~~TRINITY_DN114042_c0_g1_i1.p1  ORF type:complete len:151 (+),score=59.16 TRINITY_DN114042_c0_g1_i1:107-559(+)
MVKAVGEPGVSMGQKEVIMGSEKKARKEKVKKVQKPSKRPKLPGYAGRRKRGSKKIRQSYTLYIYKVLKQIHPKLMISKRAMNIMNSFMSDMFDKIATEASKLVRTNMKRTLSSREVETAVRLLLPGELADHAVSEATKAMAKYTGRDSA